MLTSVTSKTRYPILTLSGKYVILVLIYIPPLLSINYLEQMMKMITDFNFNFSGNAGNYVLIKQTMSKYVTNYWKVERGMRLEFS